MPKTYERRIKKPEKIEDLMGGSMEHLYILNDQHQPMPVSFDEWSRWMIRGNPNDRMRVGLDYVGRICISTVFIGINMTVTLKKPTLFETMIFNKLEVIGGERYSTWDEALAGHERLVVQMEMKHGKKRSGKRVSFTKKGVARTSFEDPNGVPPGVP